LGCARGFHSRTLLDFGLKPQNYFGVDVIENKLAAARSILPAGNYYNMSADNLSFNESTFDVVLLFRLYTSIHDNIFREKIFTEAMRVLKTDGIILYWDVIPSPTIYQYLIRQYTSFKKIFRSKKDLAALDNVSEDKVSNWIQSLSRNEVEDSMRNHNINIQWEYTGIRHEFVNQLIRFPIILDIIRRIRIPFFCNSILGIIKKDLN